MPRQPPWPGVATHPDFEAIGVDRAYLLEHTADGVGIGSFLSHAGTVAREYQVPCLVDVRDCTRQIRTGQRIRVCATGGFVEVLE